MPAGVYRVMDGDGVPVGAESFQCAPGMLGWRYVGQIETADPEPHREVVDLAVDREWRPVRVRVETGEHRLSLAGSDAGLAGERDGESLELPWGRDSSDVDYLSPCFNAVTATRLGRTADIEAVYLAPVTLEPRYEAQRYELLRDEEEVDTPVGRFTAARWRYTSLRTGWTRPLWVAQALVVAFEGFFELAEYDPGRGPFPRPAGR